MSEDQNKTQKKTSLEDKLAALQEAPTSIDAKEEDDFTSAEWPEENEMSKTEEVTQVKEPQPARGQKPIFVPTDEAALAPIPKDLTSTTEEVEIGYLNPLAPIPKEEIKPTSQFHEELPPKEEAVEELTPKQKNEQTLNALHDRELTSAETLTGTPYRFIEKENEGNIVTKFPALKNQEATRKFDQEILSQQYPFFLPANSLDGMDAYVEAIQSRGQSGTIHLTDNETRIHLALINELDDKSRVSVETLQQALDNPERQWTQGLSFQDGDRSRRLTVAKRVASSTSGVLTGAAAKQAVRSASGGGVSISVPFYHSGVWFMINTPSLYEQTNLWESVMYHDNRLARMTKGLPCTTTNVHFINEAWKMFERNIVSCSLETTDNLLYKISGLDIQTMLWALLTSIFPHGHSYNRILPIVDTTDRVNERGIIDFTKMDYVDFTAFKENEMQFMYTSAGRPVKDEEHRNYTASLGLSQRKNIKITDELSVDIEIPSLGDIIASGNKWQGEIQGRIQQITESTQLGEEDKARKITLIFNTSRGRQYAPFVKTIYTPSGKIDNVNDIEEITASLIEQGDSYTNYVNGVSEHIAKLTRVIYAIPAYHPQVPIDVDHEHNQPAGLAKVDFAPRAIPVDLGECFLTLLGQKAVAILNTY